ncbi:MAG: hypothetical protein NTU52_03510, partial [Actinobacteria bacterium]|nr:hypothetical protein [Actinomycetota bacterium]
AAAEKVPWSAMATKLCNCLISMGETSFLAQREPISKNDSNYRLLQLECCQDLLDNRDINQWVNPITRW